VELTQDKIDLISSIIKKDRKYPNNEDLYDDFFNETCKRSMSIINAIDNEATLSSYVKRIATTSIINVLKDSGRLRRTKGGYVPIKETSLSEVSLPEIEEPSVSDDVPVLKDYSGIHISYAGYDLPETPEELVIQKDVLDFISKSIIEIDKENEDKKYLEIYTLRYDKGLTQRQIADEVGISQSEVSKRLFDLMETVKDFLEQ
jgi:RNA polymerase sigma factor (sigma-70 family)